jgi:putative endonuclease
MAEEEQKQDHKSWCVYILECKDNTLYTGVTNDLDNRLFQHNHGTVGAKYTRARRPVKLVYSEACDDKVAAMQREYAIKKLSRPGKLLLISKNS